MDLYRVIITPRAAQDLEKIYAFISADSVDGAVSMVTQILDGLERLKVAPHRQVVQAAAGLRSGVRALVVEPYIVYFRAIDAEKVVRVLHVRHGARRKLRRFPK